MHLDLFFFLQNYIEDKSDHSDSIQGLNCIWKARKQSADPKYPAASSPQYLKGFHGANKLHRNCTQAQTQRCTFRELFGRITLNVGVITGMITGMFDLITASNSTFQNHSVSFFFQCACLHLKKSKVNLNGHIFFLNKKTCFKLNEV